MLPAPDLQWLRFFILWCYGQQLQGNSRYQVDAYTNSRSGVGSGEGRQCHRQHGISERHARIEDGDGDGGAGLRLDVPR